VKINPIKEKNTKVDYEPSFFIREFYIRLYLSSLSLAGFKSEVKPSKCLKILFFLNPAIYSIMTGEIFMALSDEEIAEIAHRAVKDTMKNRKKYKEQSDKSNKRNSLLAFVLGTILTIGGVLSLNAGIGIYLLIAGFLFLGLGVFLLLLTRIT
jgi:hypothetical protein